MFIAVEGCTATGKTTLMERLHDELEDDEREINWIHHGQPAELTRHWALKQYATGWETPNNDTYVIGDRWHWGEMTYSPVYRPDTNEDGYGLLGRAGWRWTELFLASRGAAIAYLRADNDTLAKRLEERGDDHVDNLPDLFRISSLYESARRDSITMAASLDTSDSELTEARYESFVSSLIEEARQRATESRRLLWLEKRYVGRLLPSALLVGDARNTNQRSDTVLPFYPAPGNSGEYLLNALPDMFWRSVGIVNGSEIDNLIPLWEQLGKPPIVALGKRAKESLQKYGHGIGDVTTTFHPQYVRRFMHDRQKEYGDAIVAAASGAGAPEGWSL